MTNAMSLTSFCRKANLHIAVERTDVYHDEELAGWIHHWVIIWRKNHGEFGFSIHDPLRLRDPMDCLRYLVEAVRDVENNNFKHYRMGRPSTSEETCRSGFVRVGRHATHLRAMLGSWYDVLINEVAL